MIGLDNSRKIIEHHGNTIEHYRKAIRDTCPLPECLGCFLLFPRNEKERGKQNHKTNKTQKTKKGDNKKETNNSKPKKQKTNTNKTKTRQNKKQTNQQKG